MKICVICTTYYRKNGTSKKKLLNLFKILENQTFKNFKFFLIGDYYEKKDEFEEICQQYNLGDFYYENLNIHFRDLFKIKYNRWTSGGLNSITYGIKKAINENFDYYFHIDDDDFWKDNHMEIVVSYLKKLPLTSFSISKSNFKNKILPKEYEILDKNNIEYNNITIKQGNSVHASWCINLKKLGNTIIELFDNIIEEINKIKNKEKKEEKIMPGDWLFLKKVNELQKQKKIYCLYIPILTVTKKTDGNVPK